MDISFGIVAGIGVAVVIAIIAAFAALLSRK